MLSSSEIVTLSPVRLFRIFDSEPRIMFEFLNIQFKITSMIGCMPDSSNTELKLS